MHITTRGARIWVHEQGTGPALLLLGGLSDPAETWQAQIDTFSDSYRVIAPDNRGAGRSPIPPAGITIRAMAEDAADVLRERGVEQAHVMGFSMGGAIAQELALAYPELVRSLVLNGSYSHPDAYFRQMVLSWMTTARHASSERERRARRAARRGAPTLPGGPGAVQPDRGGLLATRRASRERARGRVAGPVRPLPLLALPAVTPKRRSSRSAATRPRLAPRGLRIRRRAQARGVWWSRSRRVGRRRRAGCATRASVNSRCVGRSRSG